MITKYLSSNEVLALLFLSTDVNHKVTTKDIEMFFNCYIKIKKYNKSNYLLEIDFPMYKNFDNNIFYLDDDNSYIMNPSILMEERKNKLIKIYNDMLDEYDEDIDSDFKIAISLYNKNYIANEHIKKVKIKNKIFKKNKK